MKKQKKWDIFTEQQSLKPDRYPWTNFFVESIQNSFWTHRLFSFQSDVQDFKVHLNEEERQIIIRALSTIGQLEISVKKFWAKIGDNLPHPSIIDLGFTMASNEVVHGNAYSKLIESLGINDSFDEILKLDIIQGRVNYLKKYLHKFHSDNKKQFIYSIILFTLFVENIALFSQFYTICWFGRYKNVLKDTNKQVEYTSREEALHANVGIKIINTIREEFPELFDEELEDRILKESVSAVKYECQIIEWILDGYSNENINSEILQEFIKYRLNNSLIQIGYNKIFDVNEELLSKTNWFDAQVLGNSQSDFFHTRPTEYGIANQSFSEDELF
jgi:ribonucleoside-diphosphate reductase beta chain